MTQALGTHVHTQDKRKVKETLQGLIRPRVPPEDYTGLSIALSLKAPRAVAVGGRIAGFSSQKSQCSVGPFELPCGRAPLEQQLNKVLIVLCARSPKTREQLTLSDKVTKRSLTSNPVNC